MSNLQYIREQLRVDPHVVLVRETHTNIKDGYYIPNTSCHVDLGRQFFADCATLYVAPKSGILAHPRELNHFMENVLPIQPNPDKRFRAITYSGNLELGALRFVQEVGVETERLNIDPLQVVRTLTLRDPELASLPVAGGYESERREIDGRVRRRITMKLPHYRLDDSNPTLPPAYHKYYRVREDYWRQRLEFERDVPLGALANRHDAVQSIDVLVYPSVEVATDILSGKLRAEETSKIHAMAPRTHMIRLADLRRYQPFSARALDALKSLFGL